MERVFLMSKHIRKNYKTFNVFNVHYDHNKEIYVATDASNSGLEAILLQKGDNT